MILRIISDWVVLELGVVVVQDTTSQVGAPPHKIGAPTGNLGSATVNALIQTGIQDNKYKHKSKRYRKNTQTNRFTFEKIY